MSINYIKIEKIGYFLFLLVPLFFISGPFLTDLSLCLIAIIFLISIIKKNLISEFFFNRYSIAFFTFYSIILLSSLSSDSIFFSFESSLFYFRFFIFSVGVCYLLKNYEKSLYFFCLIFLTAYLFIIFDGYFQYFIGFDIFGYIKPLPDRLSGPFRDELILGSVVARFFPFAIFCLFVVCNKYNYNYVNFFYILIIITSIITFLSGERTSIVLLTISQIILLAIFRSSDLYKLLGIFILLLLIFMILIQSDQNIKKRMLDTTINQVYTFDNKINRNNGIVCVNEPEKCKKKLVLFSINHHNHYITGLKMFLTNPILGHGPKMFRKKCSYEKYKRWAGCSTHPHNMYIQLASETGIMGIFIPLFLFLNISFLIIKNFTNKVFKKSKNINNVEICFLTFFFICLFPFAPSGNIFNNYLSFIYFLPLGFYIFNASYNNQQT